MLKAFLDGTREEVKIGDKVINFRGEEGTLECLTRARIPGKSGKVVVNGRESYDRVWDLQVMDVTDIEATDDASQPLSGEELLRVLIKHYASARLSGRDVLAAELLTVAAQHALGLSEDAATERVGELLEEFYASRG